MTIEILSKGLSLTYINKKHNNYFIPFNAIVEIGPIELKLDKSNYDCLSGRYFGEYIFKFPCFMIKTSDYEYTVYISEDAKKFPRKSNKKENIWKRIFIGTTDKEGLSKEAREFAITEKCEEAVKHLTELRNNVIEAFNKELKNENIKQKWFTLREKLPELNTYVLLYVNRPWNDVDDPKYVVAKFVANCEKEDKIKYLFKQFGPDTFTLDEVKYWTNID